MTRGNQDTRKLTGWHDLNQFKASSPFIERSAFLIIWGIHGGHGFRCRRLDFTVSSPPLRCAALVRLRTAMENEWIAARLSMGGSSYVSSLVHRLLRDTKERRTLAAHERALDAESEKVEE